MNSIGRINGETMFSKNIAVGRVSDYLTFETRYVW